MKNVNKILAVSIIAMLAVPAAHAKIVSETMLGEAGHYSGSHTVQSEINAKANSADLATVATSGAYNDLSGKPTLGTAAAKNATDTYSATGTDVVTGKAVASAISGAQTTLQGNIDGKQDKLNSGSGGNISITSNNASASGVVKTITASDGSVSVVRGTIASGDIANSAVGTNQIAGSAVTAAKLASDAVETAKIKDANVTKAKLESSVQASLDKADSALQAADIAGKQDIQIGAAKVSGADSTDKDKALVVDADGKIAMSTNKLGSAAYTDSSAYDASGAANTAKSDVETKLAAGANGYDINAKSIKVSGASVLTSLDGAVLTSGNQSASGTKTFSGTVAVTGNATVSGANTTAGKTANSGGTAVAAVSDGDVKKAVLALDSKKEEYANKVTSTAFVEATHDNETYYPTIKLTNKLVNDAVEDVTETITGIDQAVTGLSTNKQDKLTSTGTGANVTSSGDGNVVTGISAANGVVTVTKGSTAVLTSTNQTVGGNKTFSGTSTFSGTTKVSGANTTAGKDSSGTAVAAVTDGDVKKAVLALDSKKEEYANKVTSMDANSTDAQYPSAKAVYNAIETAKTQATGAVSATGSSGVNASASNGAISVSGVAATSSSVGVVQLASGSTNTTAENVSNKISATSGTSYTSNKNSATMYPSMATANQLATDAADTKQSKIGGTAGQLVVTTGTAGTVAYTDAVPATVPQAPSTDGMFVLTAKTVSGTTTYYWEDIGR